MPVGQRNIIRPNDSASLWNCTLSPGWTREESDTLANALTHFGVGCWKDIIASKCLPGKTIAQLNLQTQRLLGQQSTADVDFINLVCKEFQGLHVDPKQVGQANSLKQGPEIKRKNGFIINTGKKLTREELKQRKSENKQKFEVDREIWENIELPKPSLPNSEVVASSSGSLLEEKRTQLEKLKKELASVQLQIQTLKAKQGRKKRKTTEEFTDEEMEEESEVSDEPTPKPTKPTTKSTRKKDESETDEATLKAIAAALAENSEDEFMDEQISSFNKLKRRSRGSRQLSSDDEFEDIEPRKTKSRKGKKDLNIL
ncbi:hypothetical protein HK098_003547 [Nowakowskiella sp. JEL0407]|nr:hypothetical protein HK098_003547 [Nowakowskiella sp. JEL0407]